MKASFSCGSAPTNSSKENFGVVRYSFFTPSLPEEGKKRNIRASIAGLTTSLKRKEIQRYKPPRHNQIQEKCGSEGGRLKRTRRPAAAVFFLFPQFGFVSATFSKLVCTIFLVFRGILESFPRNSSLLSFPYSNAKWLRLL